MTSRSVALVAAFVAISGVYACSSSTNDPAAATNDDGGAASSSSSSSGTSGTSGTSPGPGAMAGSCRILPNDNPWNVAIDSAPVDTDLTASVLPSLAQGATMHPDWGALSDNYGIPITTGPAAALVPITWSTDYGKTESDSLACPSGGGDFCYPIPLVAKIEGGAGASSKADRHVLFLATDGAPDHCTLYELYNTQNQSGAGFTAASGAIWHLDSNALRTENFTSADAAGLPILPGLVRWEEIEAGVITHAIRFTMGSTRNAYIHPATHAAGDDDASKPPMGMRVRLKTSFDDSSFTGPSKIVATAMKTYGLILADNGSDWYISGESNDGWAPEMDDLLTSLRKVKGSDFEIVKTGDVVIAKD